MNGNDVVNGNSTGTSVIAPIPPPRLPPNESVVQVALDALSAIGNDVKKAIAALEGLAPPVPFELAQPQPTTAREVMPLSPSLVTAAPAVVARGTLPPGATLRPGDEVDSPSGNARFVFQTDGNLVLYVRRAGVLTTTNPAAGWVPRWSSRTNGKPAVSCVMQLDGNLVIYPKAGKAIWSSNTAGHPGAFLAVQDDENVVIYQGTKPIWSTNSWIQPARRSRFDPATMGFQFLNDFPDGYWQFGAIRFATRGLCGGMSFGALDYFKAGMPIPSTRTTPSAVTDPLGKYIDARQQQSVEANLGGWAVQVLNPDDHALNYWATHDEWNKMTAKIDAGDPAPIGLGVYLNGSASHQELATGYQVGAQERWIFTYDSDNPRNESYVYLAPGRLHWTDEFSRDWRGFFVESYSPERPV